MATLGELAVGSIVKLNVDGAPRNFIVVHQGRPSAKYDSSCDGTWLLMEDIYRSQPWYNKNTNDYSLSYAHEYLDDKFINLLDSDIKNAIKQVKLPYTKGTGSGGALATGSGGFSTKVFSLSCAEINYSNSKANVEGAVLGYFNGATNSTRVAKLDGSTYSWWLRSPKTDTTDSAWYIGTGGGVSYSPVKNGRGVRPAFVLPSTLSFTEPTAPGIPSFSEPKGGEVLTVSWTAASDEDGNLSGYILEVQLNGGSWAQVYKGSAQTYSYTVPDSTNTIAFRVKAYDSYGAESAYATSATAEVSSGGISGVLNINGVVYELTGEGYVNIGGILCDIVDSSVNIGGTLNSMKG